MKTNRIQNIYHWQPRHIRIKFPPQPVDNREPLYYVVTLSDKHYFVNNTNTTIEKLVLHHGGMLTVDDEVAISASEDAFEYKDILPKEGVLIDEDDPYDDFTRQWSLTLISNGKSIQFLTTPIKTASEHILLWDTQEAGKRVSIVAQE